MSTAPEAKQRSSLAQEGEGDLACCPLLRPGGDLSFGEPQEARPSQEWVQAAPEQLLRRSLLAYNHEHIPLQPVRQAGGPTE